jgi:hypothetical protein
MFAKAFLDGIVEYRQQTYDTRDEIVGWHWNENEMSLEVTKTKRFYQGD